MITLVTAFFNINRDNWSKFRRSSEAYIEAFSKWAHLENTLIVYLEDEDIKKKVLDIRSEYGLSDKTHVELIEDIESVDPDIYRSLNHIANDSIHRLWRYKPNNPEVINADYNYVMFLKFWCLKHAFEQFDVKDKIAWIDFGYAHNGALYPYEEDFCFEWDYRFSEKVTLFSIKDIETRPAFDVINTMDTYIMGCIFVVPVAVVERFYDDIRSIMISILSLGYMDDDQILLLMALKMNPDYICALSSNWFLPLKQYGNSDMRVVSKKARNKPFINLLRKIKRTFYRYKYCLAINSHIKEVESK